MDIIMVEIYFYFTRLKLRRYLNNYNIRQHNCTAYSLKHLRHLIYNNKIKIKNITPQNQFQITPLYLFIVYSNSIYKCNTT